MEEEDVGVSGRRGEREARSRFGDFDSRNLVVEEDRKVEEGEEESNEEEGEEERKGGRKRKES